LAFHRLKSGLREPLRGFFALAGGFPGDKIGIFEIFAVQLSLDFGG
jgi:hypothetical protein